MNSTPGSRMWRRSCGTTASISTARRCTSECLSEQHSVWLTSHERGVIMDDFSKFEELVANAVESVVSTFSREQLINFVTDGLRDE